MQSSYVAVLRDPSGLPVAVDLVVSPSSNPADPRAHCKYSNASLRELRARCGAPLRVITTTAYRLEQLEAYRTEPREISASQYEQALCALPPSDWTRTNGVESFKCSERIVGDVAQVYAKSAGKFYGFRADNALQPWQIAARINALAPTAED